MTNQENSNARFHFKNGDSQIDIPAETLEDAVQWVRDYRPKPINHDFILDQDAYDMVRQNRTRLEDGIVAQFYSDGVICVLDNIEEIRREFFKYPLPLRQQFIDRYKPMFHHIFADGWDTSLAKLKKDQIVVGKTYRVLCNNGEFDQEVIVLDESNDIHYPHIGKQEKYARVHDVRLGKEHAYFIQIDKLRETRPELKSFRGYYYVKSVHDMVLIPAETLEIPVTTLQEAIEWVNNRNDQPDNGYRILDESVYNMMAPGFLYKVDIEVARFSDNKWMITDPRKQARDAFLKLPIEERNEFKAMYKPECQEIFTEDWKPELGDSRNGIESGYMTSRDFHREETDDLSP